MKLNNRIYLLANLIIIGFTITQTTAQSVDVNLKGFVKHNNIYIPLINIINKTSGLGTSSNMNGEFTIIASKGDTLIFSSISYKNRNIRISDNHINFKSITVYLESDFTQLDEVMLNSKIINDWSNSPVTPGTILQNDNITSSKAPDARKFTDPNANGGGFNFISIFMQLTKKRRLKRKERKKKMARIKQYKDNFTETLIVRYKESFFIENLHIQEHHIYLFLDFCQSKGLNELYNSNEIVIKDFLFKQTKKFNLLQNKSE